MLNIVFLKFNYILFITKKDNYIFNYKKLKLNNLLFNFRNILFLK